MFEKGTITIIISMAFQIQEKYASWVVKMIDTPLLSTKQKRKHNHSPVLCFILSVWSDSAD